MSKENPRMAIEEKGTFDIIGNYLPCSKCSSCKYYFFSDKKHHCTTLSSKTAAQKSIKNNYLTYDCCLKFKQKKVKNQGIFNKYFPLFALVFCFVVYYLIKYPGIMIMKFRFYWVVSGILILSLFLQYLFETIYTKTVNKRQDKDVFSFLSKLIRFISSVIITGSFFIKHNGLELLVGDPIRNILIWIIFLIIIYIVISILLILYIGFILRFGLILSILSTIIFIIGLSIIFFVFDYFVSLIMITNVVPDKMEFDLGSSIVE